MKKFTREMENYRIRAFNKFLATLEGISYNKNDYLSVFTAGWDARDNIVDGGEVGQNLIRASEEILEYVRGNKEGSRTHKSSVSDPPPPVCPPDKYGPKPGEKLYSIWSEGYACTGESGGAQFRGKVSAVSFRDACIKCFERSVLFDLERMTHWGCKLFDNEADARKQFG